MKQDIAQIRQDYTRQSLDIQEVSSNPFAQFEKWMEEAINAEVPEPTAMTLATVDSQGVPSARIVLLKGADEQGLVFFTNYASTKGKAMASNSQVCLNFFWAELERQIRIIGKIEKVSEAESQDYFQSRPRASQIGAWVSPQSQVVPNRAWLEQKFIELEQQFANQTIPKPEHWGGYRVIPQYFEFWQGRPSRLHDRIVYEKSDNDWQIQRLAP
ncbi:MAG: pyridoxamine 5'-phosphate oxidase [Microscillaceae bacterium]|jgi:pyridoxamine 5'-phosphate oxidase|nr:pyridoxamine 5'-phosphate oxidase [Microscillaceae bacterium]